MYLWGIKVEAETDSLSFTPGIRQFDAKLCDIQHKSTGSSVVVECRTHFQRLWRSLYGFSIVYMLGNGFTVLCTVCSQVKAKCMPLLCLCGHFLILGLTKLDELKTTIQQSLNKQHTINDKSQSQIKFKKAKKHNSITFLAVISAGKNHEHRDVHKSLRPSPSQVPRPMCYTN